MVSFLFSRKQVLHARKGGVSGALYALTRLFARSGKRVKSCVPSFLGTLVSPLDSADEDAPLSDSLAH